MKPYLFILICFLCISSNGQTFSSLQTILSEKYPKDVSNSEEWIFYNEKANFEKLDNSLLNKYFPNYNLYAVDLTFKRRPEWICRCVVFFDTLTNYCILQGPLSMNNIDEKLISVFKSLTFIDKSALINFIDNFHQVRQIGSQYKFINTGITDSLLSYYIVWFNDQDYITKPYKETVQTKFDSSQIMGNFYIKLEKNKIKDYIELSPNQKLK